MYNRSMWEGLRRRFRRTHRFPGIALRDPGRSLTVRMDTTNHCNLRCSMCPMRLSEADTHRVWMHMDEDLFLRIRRQVFPLAKLVGLSCGAEPFCNPRIGEHLKALCDSGVPARELVTNGTLLDEENIRLLLRYPPTTLFVSVDGATPETHGSIRGGADLNRVVRALQRLSHLRGHRRFPMVALSTTLQRDNFREIPGIVDLAARVGAQAVGVAPLVPYHGLSTLESVVSPEDPEVSASLEEASVRAGNSGVRFRLATGEVRSGTDPCPYLTSTVYLAPDGAVYPCPYWNTGEPLGDLRREDFQKIRASGRPVPPGSACRNCPEITRYREEVRKAF